MYRELGGTFRQHYSTLWAALLKVVPPFRARLAICSLLAATERRAASLSSLCWQRDHHTGRVAASRLGVSPKDYDALSLLLTFRSSTSDRAFGTPITKHERKELRNRFGDGTKHHVANAP